MAVLSPTTSPSAGSPTSSGGPPPPASVSSPSQPPAASPLPVEAEDAESPESPTAPPPSPTSQSPSVDTTLRPSSNALRIPPPPPSPPQSVTPSVPLPPPPPPPPPSSLNSNLKSSPPPLSSNNPPPGPPPAPPPEKTHPPPPPSPQASYRSPREAPPPPSPQRPPPAGSKQLRNPPPPPAPKAPKGSSLQVPSPKPPETRLPPPPIPSPPLVVVSPKPSITVFSPANADAPSPIHYHIDPSSDIVTHSRVSTGSVIGIGIGIGIIALSFICLVVWCTSIRRRRRKMSGFSKSTNIRTSSLGSSPASSDASVIKIHSSAPLIGSGSSRSQFMYSPPKEPQDHLRNAAQFWFTLDELENATNWFSSENLLGEGGFGTVYKGCLTNGREIAVKRLKMQGGDREFKVEVEIISRIHHRHLVSLLGYCIADDRKLLVYDYVPNNTLYFHLHSEGIAVLDWAKRVKIAVGAARGIAYLHEDCRPRIIHRDIKSSNILLDNNFEARVSDFGVAKIALDAITHITTRVMGTFGYMAPEYALSGKLTEKSDVYSFGVVLLELITGRKPVDISLPLGDEGLVEWARPLLSRALETGEFERLVDPRLDNNYAKSEMSRMIEAAAACVQNSAAKRPRMGQIVRAFNNLSALDLMNGMRLGESEVFNSEEQSVEIEAFRRIQLRSQGYSTEYFSQISSFH